MKVTNWNNYPVVDATVLPADSVEFFARSLDKNLSMIVRGNGRCYGDASLAPTIISSLRFNRIIHFDVQKGIINCQSGVLLSDILEMVVPRGWFLPVTPGTKFVTVGGAVASDVHGKNHHSEGGFSDHVTDMVVLTGKGERIVCNAVAEGELFQATFGGMGLTGIILEVTLSLKRIETTFIRRRQLIARNLEEIMTMFLTHSNATYSVAWIDCLARGKSLGRSLMLLGEHATEVEATESGSRNGALHVARKPWLNVPFHFPSITMNKLSVQAFNAIYYYKNSRQPSEGIVDYDQFFYPLDFVLNWNRLYGRKGFVQYQFVLPLDAGGDGLSRILSRISDSNKGSFLSVLKLFGAESGLVSFPMKGFTLALDFPVTRDIFSFLDELDHMVADYGGRIYLSKDARMKKEIFYKTYRHAHEFRNLLARFDPGEKLVSLLARRLELKS